MAEYTHWPSGARDTTEFPDVDIQISASFREHLASFCKMDGVGWNDYEGQRQQGDFTCADSRLRTVRKMYEKQGVIYKDNDKIRLSKLGKQLSHLQEDLDSAKELLLEDIRKTAIDILSRYQLRNPIDGPDLPESCDIQPCLCFWKAMRSLENRMHPEEVNRVILNVMHMSELDAAIEKIRLARSNLPDYSDCTTENLDRELGKAVFDDQITARIAPWFSFTGWGGLIIDRQVDSSGFRNLNTGAIPLIDNVLSNPPAFLLTDDRDEWVRYYIGSAAENNCEEPNEETAIIEGIDATDTGYSLQELGRILCEMYGNAGDKMKVCSIHVFGIKYGKAIIENNYKAPEIIKAAGLNDSYYTELSKALNIYRALENNIYGITFSKGEDDAEEKINEARLTGGENILLYGVPGSGKSHFIQEHYSSEPDCVERVVFHPDYTYSDFVGQILPRVEEGLLRYVFTPGPFTKILKAAQDNPGKKFYLIVEEINRGNAPAIFGEIFQLLDRDDYGESKYSITNYDIATAVYGDPSRKISVPSNLWILATMNTSDQNVFTLDTAFQRRWTMKHIENNILGAVHADQMIEGSSVDWGTFATTVNKKVIDANEGLVSSEDKRLGAYFVSSRELQRDRFPEKVLKYMWDDAFRMDRGAAFSEEMTSLDDVITIYNTSQGADPLGLILRASLYSEMINKMNDKKQSKDSSHSEVDIEDTDEEKEG